MKKSVFVFIFVFFAFFFCDKTYSLDKPEIKSIDITSEFFDMSLKDSQMIFSKNVVIKFPGFNAQCDKAIVFFETETGKVTKIKMSSKVKVKKNSSEISGESVIFEIDNEKFTVEGNVKTKIQLK